MVSYPDCGDSITGISYPVGDSYNAIVLIPVVPLIFRVSGLKKDMVFIRFLVVLELPIQIGSGLECDSYSMLADLTLHGCFPYTDKKENQIFLIYREIQSGAAKYARKGFLILYMRKCANISP
jgi:hypothetical protein